MQESSQSSAEYRPVLLFIDDELEFLSSLVEYFSPTCDVYTASAGEDGLVIAETKKPDVIICDLWLGQGLSGIETLERSMSKSPDSERILITAHGDVQTMIQAVNRARLSYYLTKPIDFHQLWLAMKQLTEISNLRRQNSRLLNNLQVSNLELESKVEQRNNELREAYEYLQQLQKTREQMVRTAVHDLKTPIGNIDLVLNELERGGYTSSDFVELIDIARQSTGIMRNLVEDMLTVAVISQPQFHLTEDAIELKLYFETVIEPFYRAAEHKKIQLTTDFPDSLPTVTADSSQLRQLLYNLVSNAIKYTPKGGYVCATANYDNAKELLTLRVSDNGLGMSLEDKAGAFQEFGRLSARPTGNETSSGLGLYIVRKVVDLYKGSIVIHSDGLGQGTSFTVVLPLKVQIEEF